MNMRLQSSSQGGGLKFAAYIREHLRDSGWQVVDHLDDDDVDVIWNLNVTYSFAYTFYRALLYKSSHPDTVIVMRCADSGLQRRGQAMTRLMRSCVKHSDHVVFNSEWLRGFVDPQGTTPSSIILNGADKRRYASPPAERARGKKLRIVTHHWSANPLKGHDVYQALDRKLDEESFRERFEFTYIGNYPAGIEYRNARLIPVLTGDELVEELRQHDVYLTASEHEAGGMHFIEGLCCGLPLLYRESGGTPEYAAECGVGFRAQTFLESLDRMDVEYETHRKNALAHDYDAAEMAASYERLFADLMQRRDEFRPSAWKRSWAYTGWLRSMDKAYPLLRLSYDLPAMLKSRLS